MSAALHYEANKFTGKGYATGWKDSSNILQNCPTFSGYNANNHTGQIIPLAGGTAVDGSGGRNPNILTVSLTPLNPIIDINNQVMGLDSSADAATGVGVQIGYSDSINAVPTYYQTGSTVTPGKAKSKVTFNIDYK